MGPVSLPVEVAQCRNVHVSSNYDEEFLPSLCGPLSSRHTGHVEDITIAAQNNAADLVNFLKANPQLKRARLSLESNIMPGLIQQIVSMSSTRFSLICYGRSDIEGLRDALRTLNFWCWTPWRTMNLA